MTRTLRRLLPLLLVLTPLLHAQTPRLLAYYGYWDQWNTPPYTAANIPYSQLTHIVHANIGPANKADGSLAVPADFLEPKLISRAHAAGVKVEICISGSAYLFVVIDADPTLRATFAQNIANFAIANGYDGVDFDYEVPYSEEQADNFTQLVKDLRNLMPAGQYLISAAVSSSPGGYGVYDFPGLTPLLDFYNVMTYDFHGAWTNHSGHNSPLYLSPLDPGQEGSLDTSTTNFLSIYAVPAAQINLGTAFYGYAFDVEGLWTFCKNQQLCGNQGAPTVTYAQVEQLIKLGGWTESWDDLADAPYLLDANFPTFGFITYDNPTSTTEKVQYALGKQHLGGVFMWELSQDYNGATQPLLDAMSSALEESTKSK
ncbi:MAG: glycosyl hydrolase family 18 protein [Candidatus Sulfotelmatobacter sp.]|jgi:chitinase